MTVKEAGTILLEYVGLTRDRGFSGEKALEVMDLTDEAFNEAVSLAHDALAGRLGEESP